MRTYSVFIMKNGEISEEWYDRTWLQAMELALSSLYTGGKLNPKVGVKIRTKDNVCFTATNP
jgi:hypothetical protein